MEERRQCGRWRVDKTASIQLEDQGNPFECKIEDVSFKGLRIHSPQVLNEDRNMALNIVLDNDLFLNIEAAVAWSNRQEQGNTYGIYFTKIKDSDRQNIYSYMYNNFQEELKKRAWENFK
ncbi:MAG: PilZ domain-containing protein [Candidatus Omnitrophica bacterium]|nr:PilZ domain-containing protein [Candidatus Omnitrophota bacterium]